MKVSKVIRLNAETARIFVDAASRCDFDIDIANRNAQNYTVDAKSMLGVMGLDMSNPMVVTYNGNDEGFGKVLESLTE